MIEREFSAQLAFSAPTAIDDRRRDARQ
jgi:hypothetical protein